MKSDLHCQATMQLNTHTDLNKNRLAKPTVQVQADRMKRSKCVYVTNQLYDLGVAYPSHRVQICRSNKTILNRQRTGSCRTLHCPSCSMIGTFACQWGACCGRTLPAVLSIHQRQGQVGIAASRLHLHARKFQSSFAWRCGCQVLCVYLFSLPVVSWAFSMRDRQYTKPDIHRSL
jgi:hypothetical protein